MNAKLILAAAAATTALVAAPMPGQAHHSFAMFDRSKEVQLKDATIAEWQWTSPHVWLYLLVPNGTKDPDKYSLEGGNPGALRRDGFGKGTFSAGDKVTVYMSPLKNGQKGGAMNQVVMANGKTFGSRAVGTQ
jgi:hypothetical protein